MRSARSLNLLFVGLALSLVTEGWAKAEFPVVGFDVGWVVTCRDVTPQIEGKKGGSKIIEAVFRLSPEVVRGKEADLKRIKYEIYSPDEQMRVKAFAPGSVVRSDVVDGTVEIENTAESGEVSFCYVVSRLSGDGEIDVRRERSRIRYKLLVPKALLQASGTTKRSTGVYFDLRPSPQETLQKQQEFAILFDVPSTWRADYVTIECQAEGYDRGLVFTDEGNCGVAMYSVGLHLEGDDEAKTLAEDLARSQKDYFEQIAKHWMEILEKERKRRINSSIINWLLSWVRLGVLGARSVGPAMNFAVAPMRGFGTKKGEEGIGNELPGAVQDARDDLEQKQKSLRRLNGREEVAKEPETPE